MEPPEPFSVLSYEFNTLFPSPEVLQNFYFDSTTIPSSDLYTKLLGFEVDKETGEISLHLQPKSETITGLFCTDDIKLIIKSGVWSTKVAFQEPYQPTLCKFTPSVIKESSLLNTLIYVHKFGSCVLKSLLDAMDLTEVNEEQEDHILYTHVQFGPVKIASRTLDSRDKYEFGEVEVHFSLLTNDGDTKLLFNADSVDPFQLVNPIPRLKELCKLIWVSRILRSRRSCLEDMKQALGMYGQSIFEQMITDEAEIVREEVEKISEFLHKFRTGWDPPHPICSEQLVQKQWKEILRNNGLEYKEHTLSPGMKDRVMSDIRNNLRKMDNKRFNRCAKVIANMHHIHYIKLIPLIPSYLDKNNETFETLVKLCSEGWRHHEFLVVERGITELEKVGISTNLNLDPPLDLTYGGVFTEHGFRSAEPRITDPDSNSFLVNLHSLINPSPDTADEVVEENVKVLKLYYSELGVRISQPAITNVIEQESPLVKATKIRKKRKSALGKCFVKLLSWF